MTVLNTTAKNDRKSERGNVLFLILIAVALFAALSYAVTQSTRSGGGDASKETNLVNAAGITQYPASIKTAITRMIISTSLDPDDLMFDTPSTFDDIDGTTDADLKLQERSVFWPTGGGATYVEAPSGVMKGNATGTWHFNSENQVEKIGKYVTGNPTQETADIIAFLPNVKQAVCESIHNKLGLSIVAADITNTATIDITTDMNFDNQHIGFGGKTIDAPALIGRDQGCFIQGGEYVYYQVVSER